MQDKFYSFLLFCFMFYLPHANYAQKKVKNIGAQINTKQKLDTTFIKSTYNNLQFRFDVNTISNEINFSNPGQRNFDLEPNEEFRARISAAYRWLNLSFSFVPNIGSLNDNEEEKGTSDIFGLDLNLNWNALQQQISYRRTKGYYQTNTEDYREDLNNLGIFDPYLVYPNLKTIQLSLENYYYFSSRFSSRFARNQNEIQLKSSGSLIGFLGGYYSDIDGRDENFDVISAINGNSQNNPNRTTNLYIASGFGYGYNYIIGNGFYFTAHAIPLAGLQLGNVEFSGMQTTESSNNFNLGFIGEASLGYNTNHWFGGAYYNYSYYDSPNADFRISGQSDFIMLFIGYRMKSPKFLEKTFNSLESIFKKE